MAQDLCRTIKSIQLLNSRTISLCVVDSVPVESRRFSLMTSGEEDLLSRGFSIYLQNQMLVASLVDGRKYWRVELDQTQYRVGM